MNGDEMLTVSEASERASVSPRTMRRAVDRRELGHVRIGRLVRIPSRELDAWLRRNFQPALSLRETERGLSLRSVTSDEDEPELDGGSL